MAANGYPNSWRRFARAYALDLAVSLSLVLLGARLWGVDTGQPQSIWLLDLHTAFARFIPTGLWHIYSDQARTAIVSLNYIPGKLVLSNLLFGLRLGWCILVAVPDTLLAIWWQTETTCDWITLIGFGITLSGTFALILCARRTSLMRLAQAILASPLAAVAVFWLLQQAALTIVYGAICFAVVAPWCLLCPVTCTAYWVAFPGSEHGAVAAGLLALSRVRIGRPPKPPSRASTVTLSRR